VPLTPLSTVLRGGAVVGVLDIAAAILLHGTRGVRADRILQAVAAGLLGPAAFRGGWRTAALGLFLHFVIATMVVLVYWLASRALPVLRRQPWVAGPLYGVLVYGVMNFVVLPLSRAGGSASPAWLMAVNILIHIVCVGLPTALIVSRAARS